MSSESEQCWWEMHRSWSGLSVVDPIVALLLQGACEKVLIAKGFPREALLLGGVSHRGLCLCCSVVPGLQGV